MHNFSPSKFTEIYAFGGCKGAALLFIRECVFGGTIDAQFQSLFCQNLYKPYIRFWGLQGGSAPLPKKILYSVS